MRRVDLVLAVVGSTSVGISNFQTELDIARELVYAVNVDRDSQVGVLLYSDQPYLQFNLNTFSRQSDVLSALAIPYP